MGLAPLQVYVGPAALCPCPRLEEPLLVVSGDRDEWAIALIKQRCCWSDRQPDSLVVRNGVIAKSGAKKIWYQFKQPFLNGIFAEGLISWCNQACDISLESQSVVKADRLDQFINQSGFAGAEQRSVALSLAQGDPLLTLKRSQVLLDRCVRLDLSLHPLGLLWQQSVSEFLVRQGFRQVFSDCLLWIKPAASNQSVDAPWSESGESTAFLDPNLQVLLKVFPVQAYRDKHSELKTLSDLQLFRRLVTDCADVPISFSRRELLREQIIQNLRPARQVIKRPNVRSDASGTASSQHVATSNPRESDGHSRRSIRGHVDGFQGNLSLRGWVDASSYGTEGSTVRVYWKERDDRLIGEGVASEARPDLIQAGLTALNCGFSVDLSIIEEYSMAELLDLPVTLKVVESQSGKLIGGDEWPITEAIKSTLLPGLVASQIENGQEIVLQNYLMYSDHPDFLLAIRKRLLEQSILNCYAGCWDDLPVKLVVLGYQNNAALDYGVKSESARRIELVFIAMRYLLADIDGDSIHSINASVFGVESPLCEVQALVQQLNERCFLGLQGWENRLWQTYLRPLFDVLIGTVFLQERPKPLLESRSLLEALARVVDTVYADLQLATYLRSILEIDRSYGLDDRSAALAFKSGDCFTYLMALYSKARDQIDFEFDLQYCASVVGFVDKSPALLTVLLGRMRELLPPFLADHPRQSRPRHWVDNLGFLVNASTQHLVFLMLEAGMHRDRVRCFHQAMIEVKRITAETLWPDSSKDRDIRCQPMRRWLIIGEPELTQCWMYRVEQKLSQLTSLGAEVRCLNHQQLKTWSFSHHIQWADAIIVCRLAATYPVYRAMAFARHCGKRIFSEIDDLIFTADYPSPYETYGGSISQHQYNNLSIDYPLRQAVLNYSDDVIVSTSDLADICRTNLSLAEHHIHILPNLPLSSLEDVAVSQVLPIQAPVEHRIVLSSGTLSHKQIFNELMIPVLGRILNQYPSVKLSIIGHFDCASFFSLYQDRVSIIPFSEYQDYLQVLNESSIALVPLEVHPTTHAKSAIKWMEASLCGVVSICSPVRAYTDVVVDGSNGLIAQTADQWLRAIQRLLDDSTLYASLANQAYSDARRLFSPTVAHEFWSRWLSSDQDRTTPARRKEKILVVNVFFAPQSIGGATRVAQDYVDDLLNDPEVDYDITVLCTDYDHWQSDPVVLQESLALESFDAQALIESKQKRFTSSGATWADVAALRGRLIDQSADYKSELGLDISFWRGVRVVRLCLPSKPWSKHEDPLIEAFCEDFFSQEGFDRVQCHCCQLLTASPLIVARRQGIPYDIVLHDAWWMSLEQFLVSPAGRLVDPADPLGHFDHPPAEEDRLKALERRDVLYGLLQTANHRWAVSEAFQALCVGAGLADVEVRENRVASMAQGKSLDRGDEEVLTRPEKWRVCHIGGMSLHKGYQLLRRAVHELPQGLPLTFTVIDHRLASSVETYPSNWNGYPVTFQAPVPMDLMAKFYAEQDVLIAPSIWPESFGLVTREALSAGLWVIASDAGALAAPIQASSIPVGTVVRPNHLQDLIDALVDLPNHLSKQVSQTQS